MASSPPRQPDTRASSAILPEELARASLGGWQEHEAEIARRRRELADLDRSLYRQALRLEEHDDPGHPVIALARRRIVELTAGRERLEQDIATLEAHPPSDLHPEAVEAALAAVPIYATPSTGHISLTSSRSALRRFGSETGIASGGAP